MQHDITAIKGGFPEGMWLIARFQFLLKWGYLTVVFQDGDGFRSTEVQMSGIRSSVTITGACWCEASIPVAEDFHLKQDCAASPTD